MPILPENKSRYPANWKSIRAGILTECENKCEFCGAENYSMRGGKKIVLTIAHLDHVPENCARENLRALCQKCHNRHDAKHRAQTRKRFYYALQKNLFEGN
jgi:5-methylcytosine-specific restriction endonuclease McrA